MDFCAGTGHKKNKEENNRKHIDIYEHGTTKEKNRNYPSPQNQ
jgi:hypothetical protein